MKYFLLAAISLFSTLSYSQSKKFSFKLGSEYSLPKKSEDLSFFGNDKDGIVNLFLKKEELSITRFDPKTLNQTGEKMIELTELTSNYYSEIVVDFGTNYFWVHSDWNKKEEKELLYYDKIDVVSGKITSSGNKMIETTKMGGELVRGGGGWPALKMGGKYQFNFSADKKKLLVSYKLVPENRNDKKNYDKIGFHVFDENMNKLWGEEFTMPYTEAIMDNIDFSVDSRGNAYMLAKVYDSEKRKETDKETGKAGYHYEVMKFTKGSKKIINTTITIDDYFIKEASLVENSLNEMIISCTYSKKSKGTGTDGIFLAVMDQRGAIIKYKKGYYEFPLAELEKFESARSKRKMEKNDDYEASNLKVRNLVVESDGSVFIACEEYYVIVRSYTDSRGSTRTTYTYYYGDMIGVKVNAAGNFEWLRKIPKNQRGSTGRGAMSFKLVNDAEGYYFLYLDNLKNIELKEDEVPKVHMDGFGGQVVVAKINKAGVLTKELVFDTREEDIMIFPALFERINQNQFIGRATLKKNLYKPLLITSN
jgi:hypothetical protein